MPLRSMRCLECPSKLTFSGFHEMPALKECSPPVCHVLVERGKCEKHRKQRWQEQDERRESYRQRGYTTQWDKARNAFIAEHPLCADPYGEHGDRPVAARVVDHIIPHRGDMRLFWDQDNWQSLCTTCDARKRAAGL